MRRLFWLSVGAGAGVYATRRVNRFTRRLTPEHIVLRTGTKLRSFAEEVRLQTHAREAQLREALEHDELGPPRGESSPRTGGAARLGGSAARALPGGPRALPAGADRRRRELPAAPSRRVLKGQYTIINDDKDGH